MLSSTAWMLQFDLVSIPFGTSIPTSFTTLVKMFYTCFILNRDECMSCIWIHSLSLCPPLPHHKLAVLLYESQQTYEHCTLATPLLAQIVHNIQMHIQSLNDGSESVETRKYPCSKTGMLACIIKCMCNYFICILWGFACYYCCMPSSCHHRLFCCMDAALFLHFLALPSLYPPTFTLVRYWHQTLYFVPFTDTPSDSQ